MDDLEAAFHQEMLTTYEESVKAGYRPMRFRQMVNESGGLAVAHRLLAKDAVSDGFTDLWQRNRLDLSVEAISLKPVYASLFSDEERARARQRLEDVNYVPPWDEQNSLDEAPTKPDRDSRFTWKEGDITIISRVGAERSDQGSTQTEQTDKKIWLFQANPKYYDLATELKKMHIDDDDSWSVTRYREQMHTGDVVILWQSGAQRGIYGFAELTSEPYKRDWQPDDKQIAEQPYQGEAWWVNLRLTKILAKPVLATELKQHPLLQNLFVLRSPSGTNFAVTAEEWNALNEFPGLVKQAVSDTTGIAIDAEALARLIDRFTQRYGTFESEQYLRDERTYKIQLAEHTLMLLARENLDSLIESGAFEEAKTQIKRAYQRSENNLLNQWDRLPLEDAPAEDLARRLYGLLYGDEPFAERFAAWAELLNRKNPNCWPATTYFLMLANPKTDLFVKPTPFTNLLRTLAPSLVWQPRPSAAYYAQLRELGAQLLSQLKPLGARDLIDVQSFIWIVQESASGDKGRPEDDLNDEEESENPPTVDLPLEEWLAQLESRNPFVQKLILSYPDWLQTTFAGRVVLRPAPKQRFDLIVDGRRIQRGRFNQVDGLYVWLRELSVADTQWLRERASSPDSVRSRARNGIPGIRFVLYNDSDYQLLQEITTRLVVQQQAQWPPAVVDGQAFVLVHKGNPEGQTHGTSYTFSNYVGGEHKRLATALETLTANDLSEPIYILLYRPEPFFAFTAWALVKDFKREEGPRTNEIIWTLTLAQHEFPIPVGARELIDQITWLNQGLVAFRGYSIRQIAPTDFRLIMNAARQAAETTPIMTFTDAAFTVLHQAGDGPLHLNDILTRAEQQGLLQSSGQTPLLSLSSAMLRDERFQNQGRNMWQLVALSKESTGEDDPVIVPVIHASPDAAFWRIHFPREHWDEARKNGIIGIGWTADSQNQSVKRFKRIKTGDRIVAYIQGGVIGGIGTVTQLAETLQQADGNDSSLFGGEYRQRIGVAWSDEPAEPADILTQLRSINNTALYNRIKNPHTVMPLSREDYAAILSLLEVASDGGTESRVPTAWPKLTAYRDFVQALEDRHYRGGELLDLATRFGHEFNTGIDEDILVDDLLQVRLVVEVGVDSYRLAPYAKGSGTALLRLMALALLVPAEGSADVYLLPALEVASRLGSTDSQSIHDFAPELGNERLQLLEWYVEAGFVAVENETWVAVANALQTLDGADAATDMYNSFLTTLLAQINGTEVSDLPPVDGRPLPQAGDLKARLHELAQELLIDEMIVRRIYRSLMAGRHVVLSGPPGTGKTELAKRLPALLWREEAETFTRLTFSLTKPPVETTTEQRNGYAAIVVTATEDWGVRDVVGGIGPQLDSRQGVTYTIQHGALTRVVLQHYEHTDKGQRLPPLGASLSRRDYVHEDGKRYRGAWLVIDELTRAPVDAAFGSLLTTLSGGSEAVLAVPAPSGELRDIAVPQDFRIIGTLNSFDRHFLNQMSEAIKRRFDFIDVPPPALALAHYERGIAAMQALRRLHANNIVTITSTGSPPTYRWDTILRVVPIVAPDGIQRYEMHADDLEAEAALRSFWHVFETIRVFRQLGTAQVVAIYTNLFSGVIMGAMGWQDALDTALADSLADQLQVLNRDEQRVLDVYIEYAGQAGGTMFAQAYRAIITGLPVGRKNASLHALREADYMRNGASDIPFDTKQLTDEQIMRVFVPTQRVALPSRSVFRRRLRDLIGERGL